MRGPLISSKYLLLPFDFTFYYPCFYFKLPGQKSETGKVVFANENQSLLCIAVLPKKF